MNITNYQSNSKIIRECSKIPAKNMDMQGITAHEVEMEVLKQPTSQTNKEKIIKDLQLELKYSKAELDLLKKDNRN